MKQTTIKKLLKSDARFLKELCQLAEPHDSYHPAKAEQIVTFALNVRTRGKIKTTPSE